MKIFLTGGTGFIGSHFINLAVGAGHKVIALKRKNSSSRVQLYKEPEWVVGELDGDYEALNTCEVLVHLASHSTNVPYDSLENCLYWNLYASIKLFRCAIASGISKFLIAGTCFEYGRSGERYEYIPTDAPLEPTMSYPASKAAASIAFFQLAVEQSLRMQYFRIFHVYGEGENENRLWPSLKRAAQEGRDFPMTRGEQVRDFIYVKDAAQRFVDALEFDGVKEGIPVVNNLGSGNPQSIFEFAQYWWNKWEAKGKLLPGAIPYRENEIMRFVPKV